MYSATAAVSASGPRVFGLSHVAIACADLEQSLVFYRDFLGYAEHCRLQYGGTGPLMLVCLKISDTQWLELFDGRNMAPNAYPLHQVAVFTDDAEGFRARLASAGHQVPERVWQGQMKNFGFTVPDPRGIDIEFVQETPESWMVRDRGQFLPAGRIAQRILAVGIAGPAATSAISGFYGRILGLSLDLDGQSHWHVGITGTDEHIRLDPFAKSPAMWLQVADLAAARAQLLARPSGPELLPEITTSDESETRFTLVDPDGVLIHLVAGTAV